MTRYGLPKRFVKNRSHGVGEIQALNGDLEGTANHFRTERIVLPVDRNADQQAVALFKRAQWEGDVRLDLPDDGRQIQPVLELRFLDQGERIVCGRPAGRFLNGSDILYAVANGIVEIVLDPAAALHQFLGTVVVARTFQETGLVLSRLAQTLHRPLEKILHHGIEEAAEEIGAFLLQCLCLMWIQLGAALGGAGLDQTRVRPAQGMQRIFLHGRNEHPDPAGGNASDTAIASVSCRAGNREFHPYRRPNQRRQCSVLYSFLEKSHVQAVLAVVPNLGWDGRTFAEPDVRGLQRRLPRKTPFFLADHSES